MLLVISVRQSLLDTDVIGLYVIALVAINFVSVVVQCGLGECRRFGYKLLG